MASIPLKDVEEKVKRFLCLNMMMPHSRERHSSIRQGCTWVIIIHVDLAPLLSRQDTSIDSMRIMAFVFSTSLIRFMPHRPISLGVMQSSLRSFVKMQPLDVTKSQLRNISKQECVTVLSLQRNILMMLRY